MMVESSKTNKFVRVFDRVTHTIETLLVTGCLAAMIIIVLIQIFMRNALDSGFLIGDPLVKHLVLWVTFLGAGLASKQRSHIKIDIASRILPPKAEPVVASLVSLFSASICGILSIGAYRFLKMEYESKTTFGMTEIPVWILELIIPIGFAIIALRFAIKIFDNFLGQPKSS